MQRQVYTIQISPSTGICKRYTLTVRFIAALHLPPASTGLDNATDVARRRESIGGRRAFGRSAQRFRLIGDGY
jgi:hypothetical protein